jgi:NAD(P)-dependent dehydrogenase (short-subunit alcohol dehydrogenase family)
LLLFFWLTPFRCTAFYKTIFSTGASAGLGKATAKLFAANDWNVLATMRHPAAETELM